MGKEERTENNMQRIMEDIKSGQLKQAYLLYGEEAYLIRQCRDKLKDAFLNGGDAMNVNRFEGKDVSVPSVIDMAETLPFFAEKRVILLENTGLFKSGGEQLAGYLENPAASCAFIFAENAVDKRSRLFKAVKKFGYAAEFGRQDARVLQKWIGGILKKEQKQMSAGTMQLFLENTGDDMENIRKELEKLVCYCLDKEVITSEDVEEICVHQIQNHIFDMINAIANGNRKKALQLYYDLLSLREPPMRILFLISRQFNLLLQVKELVKKGYPQKLIGEKVGLQSFIAGKYMTQASGFGTAFLKKAVNDCVETDYAVKTGQMTDQLGVELLIVNYSSGQGRSQEA